MIVALYIFLAVVAVGAVLKLTDRRPSATPDDGAAQPALAADDQCCGLHEVCEKFSVVTDRVEYFDDEELDEFKGRGADEYSVEETEMFREVLMTLRRGETAAWVKSLEMRGIAFPVDARDELLLILADEP